MYLFLTILMYVVGLILITGTVRAAIRRELHSIYEASYTSVDAIADIRTAAMYLATSADENARINGRELLNQYGTEEQKVVAERLSAVSYATPPSGPV